MRSALVVSALILAGSLGCRMLDTTPQSSASSTPALPGQSTGVFTTARAGVGEALSDFVGSHEKTPEQPVEFPHNVHFGKKIGCTEYCHESVTTGPVAGLSIRRRWDRYRASNPSLPLPQRPGDLHRRVMPNVDIVEVDLAGRAGQLVALLPRPIRHRVERGENGRYVNSEVIASNDQAFRREWVHFGECIDRGVAPRTDGAGAVRDLELAVEMVTSLPAANASGDSHHTNIPAGSLAVTEGG